ncbi:lipoprotein-releasing ABC transporter permease subunit [Thalassotalea fusca]
MFQPVSLFIGLRYSRSKSRNGFVSFITFFSIAGILLGVASLITVVSVMNGFEGELKKRILGLVPHITLSSPSNHIQDWQRVQQKLSSMAHVKHVTPIVDSEALIQSHSSLKGIMIQGIVPELEQHNIVRQSITEGDFDALSQAPYRIVIGQSLARKLDVMVGENLRLVLPNKMTFTPMGRIPVQRIFEVVAIFDVGSQVDDSVIYIHAKDAAKLLRLPANSVKTLRIYLDDAFEANNVMPKLQASFPDFSYTDWQTSQGTLFSAVKMEKNMMWLMLSLIVAVAAFNIVSAMVMVVIEKQGEIGILQTFGMDRAGILKIFMSQGVTNGLWGVFFGVILGVALTLNLNSILDAVDVSLLGANTQALPIDLKTSNVAIIAILALAMSFLATLYPAYRASLTQPAEVLRHE